jgi:hypothetical protein
LSSFNCQNSTVKCLVSWHFPHFKHLLRINSYLSLRSVISSSLFDILAVMAQFTFLQHSRVRCSAFRSARSCSIVRATTAVTAHRQIHKQSSYMLKAQQQQQQHRLVSRTAAASDDVQPVPDLAIPPSDIECDRKCECLDMHRYRNCSSALAVAVQCCCACCLAAPQLQSIMIRHSLFAGSVMSQML